MQVMLNDGILIIVNTNYDKRNKIFKQQFKLHQSPGRLRVRSVGSHIYTGLPAASHLPQIAADDRGRIQREQNIQPGTPEWFQLWFGNRNR